MKTLREMMDLIESTQVEEDEILEDEVLEDEELEEDSEDPIKKIEELFKDK